MSEFGKILVLLGAIIGTFNWSLSPLGLVACRHRGKMMSDVIAEMKERGDLHETGKFALTLLGGAILVFLQIFAFEPAAVGFALVNGFGNQALAWLVGIVVIASWVKHGITLSLREGEALVIYETTWKSSLREAVFGIPTVYLWYLFFTAGRV